MNDLIEQMKKCIDTGDTENDHAKADNILCEALDRLGQKELVDVYYKVNKWYS